MRAARFRKKISNSNDLTVNLKLHRVKCNGMSIVAVTSSNEQNAREYIQALDSGAQTRLVLPQELCLPPDRLLEGVCGLLLTGGPDIEPRNYGEVPDPGDRLEVSRDLDSLEMGLLRYALERDMPVLAICRGMQLLNVAFGGRLIQDIQGHKAELKDGCWASVKHSIYLSPGSKLAAILGTGGFFRVNSRHHQGIREAQKAPRLLASSYSLEDAIIEGLESPEHSWVVGVQCHPELQDEVPKSFANLFAAFVEKAEVYT